MRWKQFKLIWIQQFFQLIHLDCLWSFLWYLSLITDQLFPHVHRGRDIFQCHIFFLSQVQSPLHICSRMRGGLLLQCCGIPPSIIFPILSLFANLVDFIALECISIFSCAAPPLPNEIFFVIFGILLKYALPTLMFWKNPAVVPPLMAIITIDAL